MLSRLAKSKAFWTGVAATLGGIASILGGNMETGITLVVSGLSTIFLRDAIDKAGKNGNTAK